MAAIFLGLNAMCDLHEYPSLLNFILFSTDYISQTWGIQQRQFVWMIKDSQYPGYNAITLATWRH